MITTIFYVLLAAYCVVSYAVMIFVWYTGISKHAEKPRWFEKILIAIAPLSLLGMWIHSAWEKLFARCEHRFPAGDVLDLNVDPDKITCVKCKQMFWQIQKRERRKLRFMALVGNDNFFGCTERKIIIALLMVLMIACGSKQDENQAAAPVWRGDGWELVGEKDHCRLYTKTVSGHHVFWSICHSGFNSSVSR